VIIPCEDLIFTTDENKQKISTQVNDLRRSSESKNRENAKSNPQKENLPLNFEL